MLKPEFALDPVPLKDGSTGSKPSEKWKRELLTPSLYRVKGPLDQTVWRFMKFAYLESLLKREALFVPRVDLLGDPWEGSFTDKIDLRKHEVYKDWPDSELETLKKSIQTLRKNTMQRLHYVSCWHISEHESEHMWKRYAADSKEEFVAISSSIADLCTLRTTPIADGNSEWIPQLWAGEVEYIDLAEPDAIPETDLSLFYKGQEYRSDCEFRIILHLWALGWSQHDRKDLPKGVEIQIAPGRLIHKIAYRTECKSLKEKIERLLDEVGYVIEIAASKLDREANWG